MDLPGARGREENVDWEHAEEEQQKLLDDLKKEVKSESKDIGVLRKELTITVPHKVIADHLEHNYDELMSDAFVPGFRKGRAPRQLVEKRFGADVRESLTTSMVGQSYFAVVETNELDVLGEPRFRIEAAGGHKLMEIDEAMQHLKLPADGDFTYTCEVELKPKFELPELDGIEVKSPTVEVTDEMVSEQIDRRRKIRGRYEPVDGAAEKDDQVVADVVLKVDGNELKRENNIPVAVRPSQVEGIPVLDLDEKLVGVKAGETRTATATIPDDYEQAEQRGKAAEVEFHVHEIKRLKPEGMEDFLKAWGYESEDEARNDLREQMTAERDQYLERAKKAQVENYLLEHTALELPAEFSGRQTERAVLRKVVDLQQRGVPIPDIEAHIDELRTSASEEVARELRLSFILEKVAEQLGAEVTDEEVNTEIARMAQMYNRRFDRVRDDLQSRGLLGQLVEQIRQDKCVTRLLEKAKISAEPADAEKKTKKASKKSKD